MTWKIRKLDVTVKREELFNNNQIKHIFPNMGTLLARHAEQN